LQKFAANLAADMAHTAIDAGIEEAVAAMKAAKTTVGGHGVASSPFKDSAVANTDGSSSSSGGGGGVDKGDATTAFPDLSADMVVDFPNLNGGIRRELEDDDDDGIDDDDNDEYDNVDYQATIPKPTAFQARSSGDGDDAKEGYKQL